MHYTKIGSLTISFDVTNVNKVYFLFKVTYIVCIYAYLFYEWIFFWRIKLLANIKHFKFYSQKFNFHQNYSDVWASFYRFNSTWMVKSDISGAYFWVTGSLLGKFFWYLIGWLFDAANQMPKILTLLRPYVLYISSTILQNLQKKFRILYIEQ